MACSQAVEETNLIERDGLKYLMGKRTPYSGKMVSSYENGQKKEEGIYTAGLRKGMFIKWYTNGQKMEEINYNHGQMDGLQIIWFEDGRKKEERSYMNGMENGRWTSWYVNGPVSYTHLRAHET